MTHSSNNEKGFTLVEILIVIIVFGIMASMAISTYMDTTSSFGFLSGYKNVMSSVRTARSYAITNRQEGDEVPERYGVRFEENRVILFADLGEIPFFFDPPSDDDPDTVIKEYDFSEDDFVIEAKDSNDTVLDFPIAIFYDRGSGELTVFQNGSDLVEKDDHKFVVFKFSQASGEMEKYIVLFQISGLPEEYDNLDSL